MTDRFAMEFFPRELRSITESLSLSFADQKLLLVKPVQCRHHNNVNQILIAIFNQFANHNIATGPECFQETLFEQSKLTRRRFERVENVLHRFPKTQVLYHQMPDRSRDYPLHIFLNVWNASG